MAWACLSPRWEPCALGARCTGLCGGQRVTAVPTATGGLGQPARIAGKPARPAPVENRCAGYNPAPQGGTDASSVDARGVLAYLLELHLEHSDVLLSSAASSAQSSGFESRGTSRASFLKCLACGAPFRARPGIARPARVFGQVDAAEEPVGKQVLLASEESSTTLRSRCAWYFSSSSWEVVQLGFVEPFEHGALLGRASLVARQLVEVERIELELDGVADGAEAHRIAEVATGNDLELAAAHEALAIRNGEPGGQFEAAPCSARV